MLATSQPDAQSTPGGRLDRGSAACGRRVCLHRLAATRADGFANTHRYGLAATRPDDLAATHGYGPAATHRYGLAATHRHGLAATQPDDAQQHHHL